MKPVYLFSALVMAALSSCTVVMTTSSTTYSDDIYGVYTRPERTIVVESTTPQNQDVTVYESESGNNNNQYSQSYDEDEVIVDDSYTTRIYRFHRPTCATRYYDVVICETWYHN